MPYVDIVLSLTMTTSRLFDRRALLDRSIEDHAEQAGERYSWLVLVHVSKLSHPAESVNV